MLTTDRRKTMQNVLFSICPPRLWTVSKTDKHLQNYLNLIAAAPPFVFHIKYRTIISPHLSLRDHLNRGRTSLCYDISKTDAVWRSNSMNWLYRSTASPRLLYMAAY